MERARGFAPPEEWLVGARTPLAFSHVILACILSFCSISCTVSVCCDVCHAYTHPHNNRIHFISHRHAIAYTHRRRHAHTTYAFITHQSVTTPGIISIRSHPADWNQIKSVLFFSLFQTIVCHTISARFILYISIWYMPQHLYVVDRLYQHIKQHRTDHNEKWKLVGNSTRFILLIPDFCWLR